MPEYLFKAFFRQLLPFRGSEVQNFRNWRERCFFCGLAETVPWTNILAGVASKHPVVELSFLAAGYHHFFQLDRKIRNALVAIYPPVFCNGISRACVYAPPAAAAIILHERIVSC